MIEEYFNMFIENNRWLSHKDGVNGYCALWAKKLYEFYVELGFHVKIYSFNKGVHFYIKIQEVYIDCRGVWLNQESLYRDFSKYVVSVRIQEVQYAYIQKYVNKKLIS